MSRDPVSILHIRKRILAIFFITTLFLAALLFRLGWIQFVMADELQQRAWAQWNRSVPALSSRGNIFDRNENLLAGSAMAETVVALPLQIEDHFLTARALAPLLEISEERILELITQERAAVYLERRVDDEIVREIELLDLPGIIFRQEPKRYYPNDNLLSQVLGFVGTDQGWSGLEIYFEEELKGLDGNMVFPADNKGREIPGVRSFIPAREGLDLYLTIDETIQFIVERQLSQAMNEYSPQKAMALAVDPQTGQILAAASKPDFNPNNFSEYENEHWPLLPVTDTFEPGSTFKIIPLAAAIEEGLYNREEKITCEGSVQISGHTVRCWTSSKGGHGEIDFFEAVLHSCNPAFIKIGEKLGPQKMFDYVRAFGFGSRTGVDYPGEGSGLLFRPEQVRSLELATSSFGQGISVTPIQQVMAISTIANGGKLMQPYIVEEIRDAEGETTTKREPELVRQVVSEDTAAEVALIMEKVVKEGSGVNAYIDGYRIAGKTGTAQKVGSDGTYIPGEYILSFIGFAPIEDPQFLLYVAVDGAKRGPQWGSQISAPLFGNIMKDVLSYLEIPPQEVLSEGEDPE